MVDTHLGFYIVADDWTGLTPGKYFRKYDYAADSFVTSALNPENKNALLGLVIQGSNLFIAAYRGFSNGFTVHDRTNLMQMGSRMGGRTGYIHQVSWQ
jgi:hypothetical protein